MRRTCPSSLPDCRIARLLITLLVVAGVMFQVWAQSTGEEYLIPPPGDDDFTCLVSDTNNNGRRDAGEQCAFRIAEMMDMGATMMIRFTSVFDSGDKAKQTIMLSAGPAPVSAGGGIAPAAGVFFGTSERSFMRGGASVAQKLVLNTFMTDRSVASVMLNETTSVGMMMTSNDGGAMFMDSDGDKIQDAVHVHYMKGGMNHEMMVPIMQRGDSMSIPFAQPFMSFLQIERAPMDPIIAPRPLILDLNGDKMPDDNVGQPPRLGAPRNVLLPTLSQWMLLLMGTLLAVVGIRRIA